MIRVLLVDDDPQLLNLTKEFLEQQEKDFEVDTVLLAKEALLMLKEAEYDVVVSDYQMPEMDGLEFLINLRNQGKEIAFVMFTGKGREEIAVQAFRKGADGYVMKGGEHGLQYATLANCVRQVVTRRKAEEALRRSEERYRTLIELAHDGIILTEGSERIIKFVNRHMAELLGYTTQELLGRSFVDFVHPDQMEEYLATRESHMYGTGEILERHLRKKDGSKLYTLISASPIDPKAEPSSAPILGIFTDITDRKQIENQLRESEGRHRTIVENIHDALIIIGEDRLIEYANPQAERLSGFKLGEIVGKRFDEFLTPESLKIISERYVKRRKGESLPSIYEMQIVTKSGDTRDLELSASIFTENDGNLKTIVAFKDISKRKRAEEQIIFQASLLNQVHSSVIAIDLEGKIVYWNRYAEELYQWTPEETLGKYILDFPIFPQDPGLVSKFLKIVKTKGYWEDEFLSRRKDESTFPAYVTTSPIKDRNGETIGFVSVSNDVTKRRRLEDAVRQSERRLLYVLENLGAGLIISDRDAVVTYANPAAGDLLGYKPEEIIGRESNSFVHYDTFTRGDTDVVEGKNGGSSSINLILASKDGSPVPVMNIATPIFDEKGQFDGSYSIIIDLTEQKRKEDRYRFLHSLLRHDLANKLQGAFVCLGLLGHTDLTEKQEDYVRTLREICQGVHDLTNKICELEELDESVEPVDIDLDLALRSAVEEYSEVATRKGIAIDYRGMPETIVKASPLLKSVFANIVDNSIKHAECKKIEITLREFTDSYCVTIKDDGKGFPELVKKNVFERGVRGVGSSGSGIGLYLVKRIIDTSNGRILLKDSEKGAEFDIRLKKPN